MAKLRTVLSSSVGGALLGILLVSLVGPKYIQWDSTAGGVSAMCLCAETARQGADRIISLQMTGCAVGAVLGAIVGAAFLVLRRKKLPAATPPPAA
jgi:ABC-type Fe3+-siderophore transport system permease subunit